MAFQQGLSGLSASSTALDVIGNNIANSSTVGFKAANAHFADVYASMLAGAGASQVGIGTTVMAVQQEFTQGNVTTTKNPLDIAINGDGFFRMSNNGTITYSRNGQFHLDKNGFIVDDRARKLTGYPANENGAVIVSTPIELKMDASDQPPIATGKSGGAWQGVRANFNFDSRSKVPKAWETAAVDDTATADVNERQTIWAPKPETYNWSTSTSIFDTLGNAHTLSFFARKTDTESIDVGGTATPCSVWDMYFTVDGTNDRNVMPQTTDTPPVSKPYQLVFDPSDRLIDRTKLTGTDYADNGELSLSIDLGQVMSDQSTPYRPLVNNAETPLKFKIDFTGTSQYGSAFGANRLEQDGYTSGRLINVSVAKDGIIRGNYSNGQARDMGQVVLTAFTDPNGLMSLGDNQWTETATSGPPLVGAPNSARLGVLQSAAVEESNTDLTQELVKMIVQQRNYQANAQTIKTQDQIMQTLVNLR